MRIDEEFGGQGPTTNEDPATHGGSIDETELNGFFDLTNLEDGFYKIPLLGMTVAGAHVGLVANRGGDERELFFLFKCELEPNSALGKFLDLADINGGATGARIHLGGDPVDAPFGEMNDFLPSYKFVF